MKHSSMQLAATAAVVGILFQPQFDIVVPTVEAFSPRYASLVGRSTTTIGHPSSLFMQPRTTMTTSSSSSKERGSIGTATTTTTTTSTSDLAAVTKSAESYGATNGAATLDDEAASSSWIPNASFVEQFLFPVLSTALLITSNTVGASMLVLPELAASGPGMAISTAVLIGAYMLNWMSGLCIAQVAIQQYETSGQQVPSSFKEFAQANMAWESSSVSMVVSSISIFVNALVLAFDTTKAGQVLEQLTNNSNTMDGAGVIAATIVWTILMGTIVSTQSLARLSQVASVLVVGVFISFAGLLLPGLAQVSDPLSVLMSGPTTMSTDDSTTTTTDLMTSVLHMAPVFVTTLVYQNIVPTVTRLLDYDRTKVVSAITLGSFLPLCIYVAWCVAVLGGGIPMNGIVESAATTPSEALFTLFSIVTVAGSSMGALMSLAEEFEIWLSSDIDSDSDGNGSTKQDTFSWPSVALPSILALGVCQLFADDISGALQVAGSYGSPLLYGLIPVSMAYWQNQQTQKQQQQQQQPQPFSTSPPTSVLPGGMAGLGVLGLGATALMGSELTATIGQVVGSS